MKAHDHHANPQDDETPSLVRKARLAKKLQVSVRTVDNWMQAGIIPFIKIHRVALFDVTRVMESLVRFEHKAKPSRT